jgi:hypothetical protein
MSAENKAVFLSYARDDASAARRIAEALRASGLEVWFDENELRGDVWDQKTPRQIKECTRFVRVTVTPCFTSHPMHSATRDGSSFPRRKPSGSSARAGGQFLRPKIPAVASRERALIERRPTQNQGAYELYLQARAFEQQLTTRSSLARFDQVARYERVVARDPGFALAFVRLAVVQGQMYFLGTWIRCPHVGRARRRR